MKVLCTQDFTINRKSCTRHLIYNVTTIVRNTAPWRTPPCRPSPRSSPSRRAPPSPRPPPRPSAPRAPAGPRSAPCPPPPAAGAAQRPPTPAAGSGTFHQSEVSTALHQSGLTCPRQCGPAARPAGRGAPPGPCSTAGLRPWDIAMALGASR